jgi:hypothetical protein
LRLLLRILLLAFLFLQVPLVYSQKISIQAKNKPLNRVLVGIRDEYKIQLSFNDSRLAAYRVTVQRVFSSPEEAFSFLIKGLPLHCEKRGEVYLFYSSATEVKNEDPAKDPPNPERYLLAGKIINKFNRESLPFSSILVNDHGLLSDSRGFFSFISTTDSVFKLKISYLGFYILDTIVRPGSATFELTPSVVELQRVVIVGKNVEYSILSGEKTGTTKLNHKVANFLPGFSDNSVFNMLRLQPGILAAGEQSNDLVIWGSYEGQSQVLFDGVTIFGLKNFNDNISAVNPLMAKDINVQRGGFGAELGGKVGGIVNVTGIDGNILSPTAKVSINNMTLSGVASTPVGKSAAAVLAFRQTYYDLYNSAKLNVSQNAASVASEGSTVNIYPDYVFHDLNLKFSGKSKLNDTYFVSLFTGGDKFNYSVSQPRTVPTLGNRKEVYNVSSDVDEKNTQKGIASFYGKIWKNGNTSNFSLGYSGLSTILSNYQQVIRSLTGKSIYDRIETTTNSIDEASFKLDNKFNVSENQTIEFGTALIRDKIKLKEDSANVTTYQKNDKSTALSLYLLDNIYISKRLSAKIGERVDHPANIGKFYFQPRVSASFKLTDNLKLNGSWGQYNQFVVKTSVTDEDGNYHYFWAVSDNKDIPVLLSSQRVLGLSFTKNDFLVNVEGYSKRIFGITRFVQNRAGLKFVYQGDSKGMGLDVLVKKDYKGNSAWVSYSLGQTLEYFPYFSDNNYRRAPQDQTHEIKIAGLLNLSPFFVSANYVYGSGFPNQAPLTATTEAIPAYHRFDAAVTYQFTRRKFHLETGVSVLNVFNSHNIKYSNFVRLPASQTNTIDINAEAVPFTPALFLNLSF